LDVVVVLAVSRLVPETAVKCLQLSKIGIANPDSIALCSTPATPTTPATPARWGLPGDVNPANPERHCQTRHQTESSSCIVARHQLPTSRFHSLLGQK
jgi:hypothetical protein